MSPRPPGRRPDLRTVGWLLLTMTIAAAGGALFAVLGLPAPWLTGSMMAIVAAAMADLPVGLPARLRDVAFVLLGISMGSSATPESVTQMQAWPGSLALLALSVVTTLFAGAVYLERIHGWDRVTARCASMPGAFAAVIVLAATSAADLPRVVLAQSIRIFILVALMPAMLTFVGGGSSGAGPAPIHADQHRARGTRYARRKRLPGRPADISHGFRPVRCWGR